jgi:hypothetical protein
LSGHKANSALWLDEVRILIFDDPAEQEKSQRPVVVRSGRGPVKPARTRRAGAMHGEILQTFYSSHRCLAEQFWAGPRYPRSDMVDKYATRPGKILKFYDK